MIDTYQEHVQKEIPLQSQGKTLFKLRDLHLNCLPKITENVVVGVDDMKRDSWWDKCYEQMKRYLDIPEDKNLPQFALLRLLGLKVGKFIPRSENVIFRDIGYDFEVIYKTMLMASPKIVYAKKTVKFQDMQHKINYLMTIITSNIDFMASRVDKKRKAEAELAISKDPEVKGIEESLGEVFISEEEKERDKQATQRWLEDQAKREAEEDSVESYFK